MGKEQARDCSKLQSDKNGTTTGAVDSVDLLTPAAYFARYGEHVSTTGNLIEAWEKTEMDFNRIYSRSSTLQRAVFRRFRTYDAFREALRLHLGGKNPAYIKIHIEFIEP